MLFKNKNVKPSRAREFEIFLKLWLNFEHTENKKK